MIRDLFKWVVPGLVTILAGTTLCLAMTATDISQDIQSRSVATAQHAGYDWAEMSFAMRDVVLSGTTTDQKNIDAARQRLALVPGVRSVSTQVTLAPMASPYRLDAIIENGAVALSGGVPDETTRQLLLQRADLDEAALELRSGMPDRRVWVAGAQYAIDQMRYFDQGGISLSDLTVDISGRAKSARDFRDLLILLRAGPPAGLSLGEVAITPALVSPYQWRAESDGKRIEISGFVPDDSVVERYRSTATGGMSVATGLALGSGEPQGFAELSQLLVEQLSQLEFGSASIADGKSTLTGAPSTEQVAQAVTQQLQSTDTTITLEPPRIEDYWVSATLQPGGSIVFDGYAPDAATRDALHQHEGADTAWLKLGRGAPERYQSALDFGLDALARLNEGRFSLRGTVLTLEGVARSGDEYQALLDKLAEDAPQGFELAPGAVLAPAASIYEWSATKMAGETIILAGMVPDSDTKALLVSAAGPDVTETLRFASGEPRNFVSAAQTGIALLTSLSDGKVAIDGTGWTLTGTAPSGVAKAAIEEEFVSRKLAAAGWSMAIAATEPSVPQPTAPVGEPYAWSATKAPTGLITLTGAVPADALQRFVAVRVGDNLDDQTTITPAAPEGFSLDVLASIDALAQLTDGLASFDGSHWRIDGNLAGSDSAAAIDRALAGAATPVGDWQLTLLDPTPIAPPVTPPAAIVEPIAVDEPVVEPPAIAGPTPRPVDPDYAFSATRAADGTTILSGQVPTDAALGQLAEIADGDSAAVSLAEGAPDDFLNNASIGLRALTRLTSGQLDFADGKWRLTGLADDTAGRDAVLAALAASTTTEWSVAVDAPAEAAAADPVPVEPVAQTAAKADIGACVGPIADFSGRNAILFKSGAAVIAPESETALDELIIVLAACPDAVIYVEGHTDADGDAGLNLALSVARAEAVIAALIERGINPQRLYALGYGETMPIADNATSAGKRQNRRIVVTVKDIHF